ncbi:hypothetical protein B0H34DRAFT_674474 [Crassisporium funariophilum]|nr:hypothetical protein B0H34DRAFT_674474 [Crassisporium funariophilum]
MCFISLLPLVIAFTSITASCHPPPISRTIDTLAARDVLSEFSIRELGDELNERLQRRGGRGSSVPPRVLVGRGQLSDISLFNKKRVVSIGCTWNDSHSVSNDESGQSKQAWDVLSCGSNSRGQHGSGRTTLSSGSVTFPLVNSDTGPAVDVTGVRIACGGEHVMAFLTRHSSNSSLELWGCGWNEHGNLGTGTTEDLFFPEKIWSNEGSHLAGVRDVMGI